MSTKTLFFKAEILTGADKEVRESLKSFKII
jgi:hypothetical protein